MTRLRTSAGILLMTITTAFAQIPDEATKIRALKRAYELNGNSMVRWGTIDLTEEDLTEPAAVDPKEFNEIDARGSASVKVPPVLMIQDEPDKPRIVLRHGRTPKDVCERHGMHKVHYRDTWRCRK